MEQITYGFRWNIFQKKRSSGTFQIFIRGVWRKDTIEENILKLQEKKRELADQILEGEGLNGGSFTKEELMELLSGK